MGRIRGGTMNSSREANHLAIKPIYLVYLTSSAKQTTTTLKATRYRSQKDANFSFRHGFLPVDFSTEIYIYTWPDYTAGIVRRGTKNAQHVF